MVTVRRFLHLPALALGALLIGLLLAVPTTKADTISVIPPKFDLFANPGDITHENLRIQNGGTADATYQTSVEDFQAAGETGGINIINDPNAPKTNFSLASWVTVEPSSFTVPAGQEKSVNITIRVPKDAEPGGHYATVQVRLAGSAVTNGTGASVQSNLNSLLLLRVSGNLTEKLTVDGFSSAEPFYQHGPVVLNLRAKNEGNIHSAPVGTIVITDMFNRKVKEIPLTTSNVLPGSTRLIPTVWDDTNMVGRFTATLVANYGSGQTKTPLTASYSFIVLPLLYVWITLGVIVLIILLILNRKNIRKLLHSLTSD